MKDYRGSKFNKLTLIAPLGPGKGNQGHIWQAQCDCGNVIQRPGKDIAAGRIRNCGKCPDNLSKSKGGYRARSAEDAYIRRILGRTCSEALRRGIPFALTSRDFTDLHTANCEICGDGLNRSNLRLEFVNPVQGYIAGNTIAICSICKRHMAGSNYPEFLDYLARILLYAK